MRKSYRIGGVGGTGVSFSSQELALAVEPHAGLHIECEGRVMFRGEVVGGRAFWVYVPESN